MKEYSLEFCSEFVGRVGVVTEDSVEQLLCLVAAMVQPSAAAVRNFDAGLLNVLQEYFAAGLWNQQQILFVLAEEIYLGLKAVAMETASLARKADDQKA